MPRYVDGFVLVVPKKNVAAYKRLALAAGKIWKKHGALELLECVGDDLETPCGVAFPRLAKAKKGETVFFSYILYKSRAHRDAVNAKVMKDPRMLKIMQGKHPFDLQRMAYGGFTALVDL